MISTRHRFIFVHIPKTGGTAISSILLPYSDDQRIRVPGRDPLHDTFEVRGTLTSGKHTTLSQYLVHIGADAGEYRVLTSVRHPLIRALSMYFSPHRWINERFLGARRLAASRIGTSLAGALLTREEPLWDEAAFRKLVRDMHTQAHYLRQPRGGLRVPDWSYDAGRPDASIRELRGLLDLPLPPPPILNRSRSPELLAQLARQPRLAEYVRAVHAEDYDHFGFNVVPTGR